MYYKNGTKLTGKLLDNNSNPIINQALALLLMVYFIIELLMVMVHLK